MNTITAVSPREAGFWRPASRAQWAYAAGSAVAALGLLAVAAPGVPSFWLAKTVIGAMFIAYGAGALLEESAPTFLGAAVLAGTGLYVAYTGTTDHTFSHRTLLAQLLAVTAVVLVAAWLRLHKAARR